MNIMGQVVALIGGAAIFVRRLQGSPREQAIGSTPAIPPRSRRAACRR